MKIKTAFRYSLEYLKSNWINRIILCFLFGIIVSASQLLGTVLSFLPLVITIVFLLPLFFSSIILFHTINKGERLTLKAVINYFLFYFKRPFLGCFRVIFSLLKTFLFSFVLEIIFIFISYFILKTIDPNFSSSINELTNLYVNQSSSMEVIEYINGNESLQNLLFYSTTLPSIFTTLFFFYCISKQATCSLFTLSLDKKFSLISNLVYKKMVSSNRKLVYKYYWGLNWPMFVLALIGAAVGVYFSYINYGTNVIFSSSYGLCGAFLGITIFLPFYFANNETIYMLLFPHFNEALKEVINIYNQFLNSSNPFSKDNNKENE